MITRGYFAGQIIDNLASLSERVETRCQVGLTDLNRHVENLFKEILNHVLGCKLININDTRSNAPGLDLVDSIASLGVQVTSERTSKKVNDTLSKVAALKPPPRKVIVLLVGKRQNTYKLDSGLCATLGFAEQDNIWDINGLCAKIVLCDLQVLQEIHSLLARDMARVKIELEFAPEGEDYPTSIHNFVEPLSEPRLGNMRAFLDYLAAREPEAAKAKYAKQTRADVQSLAQKLVKVPRITREFFAFLIERRDEGDPSAEGAVEFDYARLKRVCRYAELDDELGILERAGLLYVNRAEDYEDHTHVGIYGNGKFGFIIIELDDFCRQAKTSLARLWRDLDFTPLDK
jgi:hypothetical protein